MASSRVASVFESLAQSAEVAESDYYVMRGAGIKTAEDLFYRVASPSDLEEFLRDNLFPRAGWEDNGTITVFARPGGEAWQDWRRGGDAAAVRKLWTICAGMAKKAVEEYAEGREGEAPKRITTTVAADLYRKALDRGLLPSLGDGEMPGSIALSAVADNFRVGGGLCYLQWERFLSLDEERRAERQGVTRDQRLILSTGPEGHIEGRNAENIVSKAAVTDVLAIGDLLRVRSAAHELLSIVKFNMNERYNAELVKMLKKTPPARMRLPSIHEARLVDRLIHEEVLSHVARGLGSLEQGLEWFVNAAALTSFGDSWSRSARTRPTRESRGGWR